MACLALAAGAAVAQPPAWQVDAGHTQVHWAVSHFGTSTSRGRFDAVEVRLAFDPVARAGEVSVAVRTASVDTGVRPLDAALRGEHFFASTAHPVAWFVSRRFRFEEDRLVALDGELTVRDVSVPLTLTAERFACGPRPDEAGTVCGGDFVGTVRRGELGMTHGLPWVGDRVTLAVQVEAFAP